MASRAGHGLCMLAVIACAFLATSSCGKSNETIAEQQAAKFDSNMGLAVKALRAGQALEAERAAFALTLLDESRCEGHAALGASLAMQSKLTAADECFARAKASVGGSVPLLVDLIAHASGAKVTPAARSDGEGTEKWESTVADAFASLVADDPVKAERLAYAATQLEEERCEIEAVRGAALMKLSRPMDAKAAFEAAGGEATGPEIGLLRILEAVAGAARGSVSAQANGSNVPIAPPSETAPSPVAAEVVPQGWCEVLIAEPDPSVVTDSAGRARMVATELPWKVRDRATGIVMLLCPPGQFNMGAPPAEPGAFDDELQQLVVISRAFYLSETEVTQEQWSALMGGNPSYFEGTQRPVERVSWTECARFCRESGLRLPSESEWEYACRAGTTGAYAGKLDQLAWYKNNSGEATHEVKRRNANSWGFHDMHGNVWEWCQDGYAKWGSRSQAPFYSEGMRLLRGGCWQSDERNTRSANRGKLDPSEKRSTSGFRVARTAL